MGKISLILGGARSGKSAYAHELCAGRHKVAFIATCVPHDDEMKHRIKMHKQSRPPYWGTFEEPKNIPALIEKIDRRYNTIIIDCLTLFVSNLMAERRNECYITGKTRSLLESLKRSKADSIIVSNELGLGLVPMTRVGRNFRDVAGRVNQIAAKKSNRVVFMVSGIPWRIK